MKSNSTSKVAPALRALFVVLSRRTTGIAQITLVLQALLFLLFEVSFNNSNLSHLRSEQRRQLSETTGEYSAPGNLPRAAEKFRLDPWMQDRSFHIDKIIETKPWAELNKTLSGYAERLKLMEAQAQELEQRLRQRERWTSFAISGLVLLVLLLVLLNMSIKEYNRVTANGGKGPSDAVSPVSSMTP